MSRTGDEANVGDLDAASDIDMDRVVADRDYRRRVIHKLRQERLLAEAQTARAEAAFEVGGGEED